MSLPFNGRRPYVVTPPTPFAIAMRVFLAVLALGVALALWDPLDLYAERAVTVAGPARVSPVDCR